MSSSLEQSGTPNDKPEAYYKGDRAALIDFLERTTSAKGRALDIGCGAGMLGAELLRRGFTEVIGVEMVPSAAEAAAGRLTGVVNAAFPDDETPGLGPFDLIVFADSLEHMMDPWNALSVARDLLAPDGVVLLSVPNVSHWSIVTQLFAGRWDYTSEGLLDRTHVRFFTPATLREALEGAGLEVRAELGVGGDVDDPAARPSVQRAVADGLAFWVSERFNPFLPLYSPRVGRFLSRFWPHMLVSQQYVVASKAAD